MKSLQDRGEQTIIGCQSYWSSLPQIMELEKFGPRLSILRDDCAGLYRRLEQGELHYAFCSSISLARNADFEMALPLGISHGSSSCLAYWGLSNSSAYLKEFIEERVQQVRELFRAAQLNRTDNLKQGTLALVEAIERLPTVRFENGPPMIRFNTGSTSWSALSRLLYRLLFGCEAYDSMLRMQASGPSAHISKGDEMQLELKTENDALQKRCSYRVTVDLAGTWRAITGLPFVSTILQKTRRCQSQSCRASLAEVTELAQMRMQVEPCTYLPDMLPRNSMQQTIDLCAVWKNLSYRLGSDDLRSLLVFLYLAKPLEKKGLEDEAFTLKMLRWQQRGGAIASMMA